MKNLFNSIELKKPQNFSDLFNNENEIVLDIGAGKGEFAVRMAADFPDTNYICIEKKAPRAVLIDKKRQNLKLTNLIVLQSRIEHLIPHCFFRHSVQKAYMNFPDPWQKNKYQNKRNMTPLFLDDLSGVLKSGADFFFASDVKSYAEHCYCLLKEHKDFLNALTDKWVVNEKSPYFQTLFYQHAVKSGSDCYFLHFVRK